MDKEQLKKDIREATGDLIKGAKMISAVVEVEYPGCGHLVFDVLFEEVDKLCRKQPEKVEPNKQEPANDLMWTADLMGSADYKERFQAEYYQTKIRYEKLHKMCIYYEAGTLDFEPTCSLELLTKQKAAMGKYLHCLEVRAQIEGIEL